MDPVTSDNIVFGSSPSAIRTTLPDGNIVISNILDKYTGENVQFIKITDPSSNLVYDGVMYIKVISSFGTEAFERVFSGHLNVTWFGAKGDGISDDREAIQQAIDYALRGYGQRVIFFPRRKHYAIKSVHPTYTNAGLVVDAGNTSRRGSICLYGDGGSRISAAVEM